MDRYSHRVNWGRGRLRPFASLASISVMFCRLNGIAITEFTDFIKGDLNIPRWPPTSLSPSAMTKLSAMLDEPEDLVRTVIPPYPWWSNHPLLLPLRSAGAHSPALSICDACVAQGYHSAFHEVPWLKHCPLHGTEMSQIRLPAVGRTSFYRYCAALLDAFTDANVDWPAPPRERDGSGYDCMTPITHIYDWFDQATSELAALGNVVWATGPWGDAEEGGNALSMLEALLPAPAELDLAVMPYPHLGLSMEAFCPSDLRPLLLAEVPIEQVCWLYRLSDPAVRERQIAPRMRQLEEWMRAQHTGCRCKWGWSTYTGWTPISPGGTLQWGSVCPFDRLAQELAQAWQYQCTLSSTSPRALGRPEWTKIERFSQQLAEHGVLQRQPDKAGNWALRWDIAPPLAKLLDMLVAIETEHELNRGMAWLSGIEEGRLPWEQIPRTGGAQLSVNAERVVLAHWHPHSLTVADSLR